MGYYKDTEQLYEILGEFFNKLKDDPEIGPKVRASGLIIQFKYEEPDGVITIHLPNNEIITGETDVKPDVEMSMKADTAHKFWLGKVNLMVALTKGDMKAKVQFQKL